MPEGMVLRRLGAADLEAYKALRDTMLAACPDAFTSDAATESAKPAAHYASRFGLDGDDPACFTLGAWRGELLVGAISCTRDRRLKLRHIGEIVGMMVRSQHAGRGLGSALLAACIAAARDVAELELLVLSVTAGNGPATRLYERAGFVRHGTLRRAIRVGDRYHDKDLMNLAL